MSAGVKVGRNPPEPGSGCSEYFKFGFRLLKYCKIQPEPLKRFASSVTSLWRSQKDRRLGSQFRTKCLQPYKCISELSS